jgi:hypothetical protein
VPYRLEADRHGDQVSSESVIVWPIVLGDWAPDCEDCTAILRYCSLSVRFRFWQTFAENSTVNSGTFSWDLGSGELGSSRWLAISD